MTDLYTGKQKLQEFPPYLEYWSSPWVIVEIVNVHHSILSRAWEYGTWKARGNILVQQRSNSGTDNYIWTGCSCGVLGHPRRRRRAERFDQSLVLNRIVK
jgi:hypothetical protein